MERMMLTRLKGLLCALAMSCSYILLLLPPSTEGADLAQDPQLPFGDINVLILTDTHSWVAGHGFHEADLDVDYGDVLSFYLILKEHCTRNNMDLWFVMNGDWIDGTGLSLNHDASHLIPLLEKMPWDAVNVGNHELYSNEVIDYMSEAGGFIDWWGEHYLSSNIVHADTLKPLGYRYRILEGINSKVLAMGFLYNMKDHASHVVVQEVAKVVNQPWFEEDLATENFDAILVLAHMDVKDPLVDVILGRIREIKGDSFPVQFVTGHTHYRGNHNVDKFSNSFEAGRYLDTLGFVSFPKQETVLDYNRRQLEASTETSGDGANVTNVTNVATANVTEANITSTNVTSTTTEPTVASSTPTQSPSDSPSETEQVVDNTTTNTAEETTSPTTSVPVPSPIPTIPFVDRFFKQKFIDTNRRTFKETLGVQDMDTVRGKELTEFIEKTQDRLGLTDTIGCAPKSYYLNRTLDQDDSIYGLFQREVAKAVLPRGKAYILGIGSFRYDLLGTILRLDDVIVVSPFNESIMELSGTFSGEIVETVVNDLNSMADLDKGRLNAQWVDLPNYILATKDSNPAGEFYQIICATYDCPAIKNALQQAIGEEIQIEPTNLFTTDLMVNFVKENWKCHGEQYDNKDKHNHPTIGAEDHATDTTRITDWMSSPSDDDQSVLAFSILAMFSITILGSVYIWHLNQSWLIRVRAREQASFEAEFPEEAEFL